MMKKYISLFSALFLCISNLVVAELSFPPNQPVKQHVTWKMQSPSEAASYIMDYTIEVKSVDENGRLTAEMTLQRIQLDLKELSMRTEGLEVSEVYAFDTNHPMIDIKEEEVRSDDLIEEFPRILNRRIEVERSRAFNQLKELINDPITIVVAPDGSIVSAQRSSVLELISSMREQLESGEAQHPFIALQLKRALDQIAVEQGPMGYRSNKKINKVFDTLMLAHFSLRDKDPDSDEPIELPTLHEHLEAVIPFQAEKNYWVDDLKEEAKKEEDRKVDYIIDFVGRWALPIKINGHCYIDHVEGQLSWDRENSLCLSGYIAQSELSTYSGSEVTHCRISQAQDDQSDASPNLQF